jgi:hypothetical protein
MLATQDPAAAVTGWRRVASENEVARCERAAAAVARDLVALAGDNGPVTPHPSLSGGGGWALLLHEAGRRGLVDAGAGERLTRRLLAEVPRRRLPPALFSGFTGTAWLRAHLDPGSAPRALRGVDERLVTRLRRPWDRQDDLLYGLVGFGVYFADRLPDAVAHEGLALVVRRLADLAERRGDGTITWVSRSRVASEPDEPARYDLGVAHGVPGTISLLACAHTAGAEPSLADELLRGAVAWVLGQRRPPGWSDGHRFAGARLPFYLGSWEDDIGPSRLAWCYGDASAALTLLHAAEALDRDDWRAAALDLARAAARREPETAGVRDAGLCHGGTGLALVFARLAALTGDAELRRAASAWLGRTLDLETPVRGFAFDAFMPDGWQASTELLVGSPGIGLGLLALSDPDPPRWDRLLLLRPPR